MRLLIAASLLIVGASTARSQQFDSVKVSSALVLDSAARTTVLGGLEGRLQMASYARAFPVEVQRATSVDTRKMMAATIVQSITPDADVNALAVPVAQAMVISEPPEATARQELAKVVKPESDRLRAHFTLASAFKSTAQAMELIPPEATEKIVAGVNKWDMVTTGISAGFAALGGIAYLNGNGKDAGGWVSLSALANVLQPLLTRNNGADLSNNANAVISKTVAQLREHAERVAVHSFLSMQLEQKGSGVKAIAERAKSISASTDPATISQSGALSAAASYAGMLDDIDRFYDSDLVGMAQSLEDFANKSFFTQASRTRMTDLAKELREAIAAWHDTRQHYMRTRDVAEGYIRTYGS